MSTAYGQNSSGQRDNPPLRGHWTFTIPYLSVGQNALQIHGGPPTWFTTIFFFGLMGLVRAPLNLISHGALATSTCVATYAACLLGAKLLGQRVRRVRREQSARIISSVLGAMGVMLNPVNASLLHFGLVRGSAITAIGPLCATGIVLLLHGLGETLSWLCPAAGCPQRCRHSTRAQSRRSA